MRSLFAAFVMFSLVAPALAVDGVLEINQTCAVQTGCFSGDTPGFPVTIDGTAGRSYRLTGDLIVPNELTSGISVSSSSITVDLNGFEIIGAACVGATTSCAPESGTGSGVEVDNVTLRFGLVVRNGSITGMGSYGVFLGRQAEVVGLRVRWNRFDGISTSDGSKVSGATTYQNGRDGIVTSGGSSLFGNVAYQNVGSGIRMISGASTISDNTVYQNFDDGITASSDSTVSGNTASNNVDDGIDTGGGSTVSGNTAFGNGDDGIFTGSGSTVSGNTASNNGDDGINTFDDCFVQSNTVRGNTGFGLNIGTTTAYRENVINSNTAGTVNGGLNLGANSCQGTTTCP